jgi:sortase (surface protein transpeptidase)
MLGSAPVALHIPSIDVHVRRLVPLGLAEDGSLEVPEDADVPGWFALGPSPGQFGPAVIAGHVDSATGPAVFYGLGALRSGDRVKVPRRDGSVATFTVYRVESYAKSEFPTREVYGNTTSRAELRLITCGGEYDGDAGYLSNTVAYARLLG